MNEFLTWSALIGAGGSIITVVTFWMNRGKEQATALIKSDAALARVELLGIQLAQSRNEMAEYRVEFARDYATHKDLAASEARYATAIDGLRIELRGMNERLDRIIEGFINK